MTALVTVKVGSLPTLRQPTGQVDTGKTDTWTHHFRKTALDNVRVAVMYRCRYIQRWCKQ